MEFLFSQTELHSHVKIHWAKIELFCHKMYNCIIIPLVLRPLNCRHLLHEFRSAKPTCFSVGYSFLQPIIAALYYLKWHNPTTWSSLYWVYEVWKSLQPVRDFTDAFLAIYMWIRKSSHHTFLMLQILHVAGESTKGLVIYFPVTIWCSPETNLAIIF